MISAMWISYFICNNWRSRTTIVTKRVVRHYNMTFIILCNDLALRILRMVNYKPFDW